MMIEELLLAGPIPGEDPGWRADALNQRGALDEAQLLDVRFLTVESSVSLLFDCRIALQIRQGNTAVLVVRGLRLFEWDAESRLGHFTAWK
ncbi:MAG TPA: hypothetical protein DIT48_02060 [Actinobacteria bacterium]|jgi:hypothetical protein|nr:hypothetical protein [Actinomycetota bacterium]HCP62864.1 hypothetical protein [Actinomycetota bacterium]